MSCDMLFTYVLAIQHAVYFVTGHRAVVPRGCKCNHEPIRKLQQPTTRLMPHVTCQPSTYRLRLVLLQPLSDSLGANQPLNLKSKSLVDVIIISQKSLFS